MSESPVKFEVCEKEPQHTSTENPVLLAPFDSEKEALMVAKSYGYVGENYFVRPIGSTLNL